jgi:prepilin-type N-terminal cleavage/methylation domain-containing protein
MRTCWVGLQRRRRIARERGMTMIELLIAMTVLAIGVAGILGLVLLAIATNSRNKGDTTSTMLSQLVMEQIEIMPANNTGTIQVADCSGAVKNISLAAGGANATATGQIDWTQAPGAVPANFRMVYAVCGPGNAFAFYDVRWRITTLYNGASGPYVKTVTVSAQPIAAQFTGAANRFKYFAPPVTLHTIVGM